MVRTESLLETLYFDYLTPNQRVVIFNLVAPPYNRYHDLKDYLKDTKPNLGNISRYGLGGTAVLLLMMTIPSGINPEASGKVRDEKGIVGQEVEPNLIPTVTFTLEPTLTPTLVATRTFTAVSTATATSTRVPPTSTPTAISPTETRLPHTATVVPSFTPTLTPTETPTPLKPPEPIKPSFETIFEGSVKIAEGQSFWQVLKQVLIESSTVERPWVNKENNISQIDVLVDWVIKYAQRKGIELDLLMIGDEINLKALVTDEEIGELKIVAETKSLVAYLNLLASLP